MPFNGNPDLIIQYIALLFFEREGGGEGEECGRGRTERREKRGRQIKENERKMRTKERKYKR